VAVAAVAAVAEAEAVPDRRPAWLARSLQIVADRIAVEVAEAAVVEAEAEAEAAEAEAAVAVAAEPAQRRRLAR